MAGKKTLGSATVLLEKDKDAFAGLYVFRLMTIEKIYELIFEDRIPYSPRSVSNRMRQWEKEGMVESIYIVPHTNIKSTSKKVLFNQKAYMLTEQGLSIALDRLNLDYNIYAPNGLVKKNHRTIDDLMISKQYFHHFETQAVAIKAVRKIAKQCQDFTDDIFSIHHGSGKDFILTWSELEGTEFKERTIRPDWVFYKPIGNEEENLSETICLEEDMITMRPILLHQKFGNYLTHLEQNNEKYLESPLHLVVSVLDSGSNKKRLRGIMSNAFSHFEEGMLKGTITVDILSNSHSPSRIAEIYEGTVFDHMPEFPETSVETFLEGSQSAYQLKNVYVKDQHYPFKNLAFQPEFCILFQRPNGQQLSVFLVSMRSGNMNSHSQLIHLQEIIEEEKLNALIIGVYPTVEEMNEDVFMDFTIQKEFRQRVIQLQSQIILGTEEELNEKRAYRVSTNLSRNNSQRLSVVSWEDVIR